MGYNGIYTGAEMDDALAKAKTALQEHQDISGKQDLLVSGTNIKTINGQSVLGEGNLEIQEGETNVQSDWNETDTNSDAYIKNKPTIPSEVTEQTITDWGFTKNEGDYVKPSTGIPKSDLSSGVQASLDKADTALQQHQDISGKQDVISDLEEIRSGAAKGATSAQPSDLDKKQDLLVSGLSIKTINGESVLGEGDIALGDGSASSSADIIEVNENGFYVVDSNLNIGFKVDENGVSKRLNVLVIGNSFSTDAFAYLPNLLDAVGYTYQISVLYVGGRTLEGHVSGWSSDTYTLYQNNGEGWKTTSSTIANAVTLVEWDYIVTHQESSRSVDYTTISPYLDTIIKNCMDALDYPFKFVWMATPAWGVGNSGMSSAEAQTTMYESIVSVAQKILKQHPVHAVIPECTAIQNARQTTIQSYGNDLFASASDRHLEDGIGRLTAAYSVFLTLCPNESIDYNKFIPVYSEVSGYPHTASFDAITNDAAYIGLTCAYAAAHNPYEVTINQE